ncbi:acyl-CoA dehydrogenase family protein [Mycolicibacterium gilvum]|uniref:Acyl-CoA dehydrogenase domain-containing protein n=1 Tax=Mycolicibacterium gilvum TaxID=1804 RepID=A0A378SN93_9MYCO|nr:acyl-CoA dehydrogenase family protein [Mycolicibacterium gilvum]MCV7055624.1 acyl-CoA dehydrogenase family protein [Mycolicibacterium gilvum]STZ44190.1 acyl-CoA dehydrogenase domain-containing protein [Mycolicibacterium gilvum]
MGNLDVPLSELRNALRGWIADNAPAGLTDLIDWRLRADLPGSVSSLQSESDLAAAHADPVFQEWERRCAEARLICPAWPTEYGGRGWDTPQMTVLDEEFYRAGVPRVDRVQGESMVGPSIILHGTEEQKAYYLPRIISGEHRYCQGFSEPGSGSDLASVRTRAVVQGDRLLITGQKVWTSRFTTANMIFVLCRTDPTAAKHRGLSYAITAFTPGHNGVEVRPIRQLTGAEEFAEVFFNNTEAPLSGVIGGLGRGWQVVQSTLGFERGGAGRATTMVLQARERELEQLVDLARQQGRARDPWVRRELAWAKTQVAIMRSSWQRTVAEVEAGGQPGRQMSTWKLAWSEYHLRLGALALEIAGPSAILRPPGPDYRLGRWQDTFLVAHSGTIYAGTSEVQRNIIGEQVLGLPREPRVQETQPR